MSVLAHDLAKASSRHIKDGVDSAPFVGDQYGRVLKSTIKAIHGLPMLFSDRDLADFEIKVGRSTPTRVGARFRSHRLAGFRFGGVLFRCDCEDVEFYEDLGIRCLRHLRRRSILCVGSANIASGWAGPPPGESEKEAVVYVVWRFLRRPVEWNRPSVMDVREVAIELTEELMDFELRHQQLHAAIDTVRRPRTELERLDWHDLEEDPD